MDIQPFRKYLTPILLNGAWLSGTCFLVQSTDRSGYGNGWAVIGIITGAIMGWTLLNLTMCIISFARGKKGVGCIYLLISLLAVLVWQEGGSIIVKTGG